MMRNLEMLQIVAHGMRALREQVVFVGGATTALYADDPASPEVRPTLDVDCVVEVSSRTSYHRLEEELRQLGFVNDVSEGAPLCRWVYRGIKVDVMPNDPTILGFSNKWYEGALDNSRLCSLPDGVNIRILQAPVFLAAKLEALKGRMGQDLRTSADFEDIVFLVHARSTIVSEIAEAESRVQEYIREEIRSLLTRGDWNEAVESAMGYRVGSAALERVQGRFLSFAGQTR